MIPKKEFHVKEYLLDCIENGTDIDRMYTTLNYMFSAHYVCKNDSCEGSEDRDAETLQEAGDPFCPECDDEMIPE